MNWYYVEKEFYDHADDIEAVNIHYVCTPLGSEPDWEHRRVTRYMPMAYATAPADDDTHPLPPASSQYTPPNHRLRKKVLKLPLHPASSGNGNGTERYHLHYYFEIFQDGHRHFSPLYTEEIVANGREDGEALI